MRNVRHFIQNICPNLKTKLNSNFEYNFVVGFPTIAFITTELDNCHRLIHSNWFAWRSTSRCQCHLHCWTGKCRMWVKTDSNFERKSLCSLFNFLNLSIPAMDSSVAKGLRLGRCVIIGRCVGINPINSLQIVYSEDKVEIYVVPLNKVKILTPLRRVKSGTILPASIWGVPNISPLILGKSRVIWNWLDHPWHKQTSFS